MTVRRVVVSGVGAALAALVLAGCGGSPYLPPPVSISSPYVSNTTAQIDPIAGFGSQRAWVKVCSIGGGPIEVHVSTPFATAGTEYSVFVTSTDGGADARIIEQTVARGTVGLEASFESTRAMRPGECADVSLVGNDNYFSAGDPYYFTVTW